MAELEVAAAEPEAAVDVESVVGADVADGEADWAPRVGTVEAVCVSAAWRCPSAVRGGLGGGCVVGGAVGGTVEEEEELWRTRPSVD